MAAEDDGRWRRETTEDDGRSTKRNQNKVKPSRAKQSISKQRKAKQCNAEKIKSKLDELVVGRVDGWLGSAMDSDEDTNDDHVTLWDLWPGAMVEHSFRFCRLHSAAARSESSQREQFVGETDSLGKDVEDSSVLHVKCCSIPIACRPAPNIK